MRLIIVNHKINTENSQINYYSSVVYVMIYTWLSVTKKSFIITIIITFKRQTLSLPFVHAVLILCLLLLIYPIVLTFILPSIFPSLTFYSWISPELYQEIYREGGLSIELAIPIVASFSLIFTPLQIFSKDLTVKYGHGWSKQFMNIPSQFLRTLSGTLQVIICKCPHISGNNNHFRFNP